MFKKNYSCSKFKIEKFLIAAKPQQFKTQNSKLNLRFPQMFHDHSDLLCQQIFCLFSVAGLVEVVHQRFTLVNPSHQVVHRHMWVAVGKIEHGQFSLAVWFYLKHNCWFYLKNIIVGFVIKHNCLCYFKHNGSVP